MEKSQHERRQHFRGKPRPGRVMPVRFRPTAVEGQDRPWVAAETRNIGIGGAFIASQAILPTGTFLTVELTLPTSDQIFTLPAVVRWVDGTLGMGVQFVGVDVDILLELNDYFSSLTGL
ncbi:MAG: type pilus assembly PilZ [Myxococcales bacterium]|nr:type pilus assembly PilZ [Myxococcales bacterium]